MRKVALKAAKSSPLREDLVQEIHLGVDFPLPLQIRRTWSMQQAVTHYHLPFDQIDFAKDSIRSEEIAFLPVGATLADLHSRSRGFIVPHFFTYGRNVTRHAMRDLLLNKGYYPGTYRLLLCLSGILSPQSVHVPLVSLTSLVVGKGNVALKPVEGRWVFGVVDLADPARRPEYMYVGWKPSNLLPLK